MEYRGEPFGRSRWWKERCLYTVLGYLGKPKSYLDVGCGDSYFIELMRGLIGERNAIGVDLTSSSPCVIAHDLRLPLDLGRSFDMVVSLEVGEHLPEESADIYCDTLIRHTGQWLVFSAAHLGQGGYCHINCQPQEYWLDKLAKEKIAMMPIKTREVALAWSKFVPNECNWAYDNLIIFRRNDGT